MKTTKPVFQKISSSVLFDVDEWTVEDNSTVEKPKVYLEFNTPPLALVLAMREAGKEGYEIYETLKRVGKMHGRIDVVPVITLEHQKCAADIYKHFQQKYTLRRIKGEYISEFMLAVDELCENRKKINLEHVKVLISMPRFYEQNLVLERLMRDHKSAPKIADLHFPLWEGVVDFVDKLHVKMGKNDETHFFFKTPDNYLMRIVERTNSYGVSAWNYISKAGQVRIKTNAAFTFNIKGYDFNVIQPSPSHMEIVSID
jgi:hypothetical protein